jgi:hypothetical protein
MSKLNEKYSYKSWKRQSFTGKDPAEFNDTEIVAAGFGQREPWTKVFPDLMKGVTFRDCNLDNCVIPAGNMVVGGTNKQIKEQPDGEFWIVDKSLHPVEPLKPWKFDEWGLSKNPADIATQASIIGREAAGGRKRTITQHAEFLQKVALQDLRADTSKLIGILKSEGKL